MKKATVKSPANIAFIKYWGNRNRQLVLPLNSSISMNLSHCYTITTVEFGDGNKDEVKIKFFKDKYKKVIGSQLERILHQVNRIRKEYKIKNKVKIFSKNSFPSDCGIAASASAFSALTYAIFEALEIKLSEKELTTETRLSGSGSATRSIPGGFVKWLKGEGAGNKTSYAYSIANAGYWELYDLVAVVNVKRKEVSSLEGHKRAKTSEYVKSRLENVEKRNKQVEKAIIEKDIEKLGEAIEADAISLHTITMTSKPPIYYLNGITWDIIFQLLELRKKGILSYFTMDAGPNVHIICEKKFKNILEEELKEISGIKFIIANKVCGGAKVIDRHLF